MRTAGCYAKAGISGANWSNKEGIRRAAPEAAA